MRVWPVSSRSLTRSCAGPRATPVESGILIVWRPCTTRTSRRARGRPLRKSPTLAASGRGASSWTKSARRSGPRRRIQAARSLPSATALSVTLLWSTVVPSPGRGTWGGRRGRAARSGGLRRRRNRRRGCECGLHPLPAAVYRGSLSPVGEEGVVHVCVDGSERCHLASAVRGGRGRRRPPRRSRTACWPRELDTHHRPHSHSPRGWCRGRDPKPSQWRPARLAPTPMSRLRRPRGPRRRPAARQRPAECLSVEGAAGRLRRPLMSRCPETSLAARGAETAPHLARVTSRLVRLDRRAAASTTEKR